MKPKGKKKYMFKWEIKFDYKECLKNKDTISKSQQKFRSEAQRAFTESVNKIALDVNDDTETTEAWSSDHICKW